MLAESVAAVLFAVVVIYALLGGADYGCGLWDLTAGDGDRAARVRRQIDRSLGPVWEANHVWLIVIIVILWTAFPRAFAAIMSTLAVPWGLVGLGVVFRGGAFVFRKSSSTYGAARMHGAVFALSSVATPFFLGTIAGAVADGRVPLDGRGSHWSSWTGPLSLVGGVLAVLVTAFLAATLLAFDAHRRGDAEVSDWFRQRALVSAVASGAAALFAAVTIEASSPGLASGLHGRGAPVIVVSAVAGLVAVHSLITRRLERARIAAFVAVGAVVTGWGVAQYPDLLLGTATIDEAAGAPVTLRLLVVVTVIGMVIVGPSLIWLLRLANRPEWK